MGWMVNLLCQWDGIEDYLWGRVGWERFWMCLRGSSQDDLTEGVPGWIERKP